MKQKELKALLAKTAEKDPTLLTNALRDAGNFVYLIHGEDLLNYDDYQHDGELEIDLEEAKETMKVFQHKLGDYVDYHSILENIANHILILRKEKKTKTITPKHKK